MFDWLYGCGQIYKLLIDHSLNQFLTSKIINIVLDDVNIFRFCLTGCEAQGNGLWSDLQAFDRSLLDSVSCSEDNIVLDAVHIISRLTM